MAVLVALLIPGCGAVQANQAQPLPSVAESVAGSLTGQGISIRHGVFTDDGMVVVTDWLLLLDDGSVALCHDFERGAILQAHPQTSASSMDAKRFARVVRAAEDPSSVDVDLTKYLEVTGNGLYTNCGVGSPSVSILGGRRYSLTDHQYPCDQPEFADQPMGCIDSSRFPAIVGALWDSQSLVRWSLESNDDTLETGIPVRSCEP